MFPNFPRLRCSKLGRILLIFCWILHYFAMKVAAMVLFHVSASFSVYFGCFCGWSEFGVELCGDRSRLFESGWICMIGEGDCCGLSWEAWIQSGWSVQCLDLFISAWFWCLIYYFSFTSSRDSRFASVSVVNRSNRFNLACSVFVSCLLCISSAFCHQSFWEDEVIVS